MIESCEAFTVETYPDREEWLKARMSGIGGSDAAAIWGYAPRRESAYSLWAKKRGLLPDDQASTEAMEIGSLIEPVIAEMYQRRTGRKLLYPGPTTILRSRRWPFLFVSVDRIIAAAGTPEDPRPDPRGLGVLEGKNRGVGSLKDWDEGAPREVESQVQHALAVTGYGWGSAAAIFGGNTFRFCDITRADRFIAAHVERCRELFERVKSGDAPPVDGSEATDQALRARYKGRHNGFAIDLPEEAEAWTVEIEEIAAEQKRLEARDRELRSLVREKLGENTRGVLPSGVIQWVREKINKKAGGGYEQMVRRKVKK